MAIGTSRITTFGNESVWGAFFTTLNTAVTAGGTTVIVNGVGGASYNVGAVSVGQWLILLDANPEVKVISAVTGVTNASCTVSALANNHSQGATVVVAWPGNVNALLLDGFTATKDPSKWGTQAYTGSRAKWTGRYGGQIKTDGKADFMLRPTVNVGMLGKAVGADYVTGTTPGTPVNTTLNGSTTAGATTVIVASAAGLLANDVIQIDTGSKSECRKIVSISTNTLTLDVALLVAHNTGVAVAKVIAPFTHNFFSATSDLPSFAMEDYVPYDDSTAANGLAKYSYFMPGCKVKSWSMESDFQEGIKLSIGYEAQDKIQIPQMNGAVTIPTENAMTFDMIATLFNGSALLRIDSIKLEGDNDLQSRYTSQGSRRKYALKAGQQAVKGSFKVYEEQTAQALYWSIFDSSTTMQLDWNIIDPATNYAVKWNLPKISIENFDDSNFKPSDLIDADINFEAVLDTATAGNANLKVLNGQYLPY
jgi:hypothetical protein